ncbi:MAG: hypothetical protein RL385_4259 [Pseudomonadota bacterium]
MRQRARPLLFDALAGLGAFTLGVGIRSVVAANWTGIGKPDGARACEDDDECGVCLARGDEDAKPPSVRRALISVERPVCNAVLPSPMLFGYGRISARGEGGRCVGRASVLPGTGPETGSVACGRTVSEPVTEPESHTVSPVFWLHARAAHAPRPRLRKRGARGSARGARVGLRG